MLVSDISTRSNGNESEISDFSARVDDTQTSFIESGAEDRISSTNTSRNKSSTANASPADSLSVNANTSQSDRRTQQEEKVSKTLSLQAQRLLEDHDQNSSSSFNQSLSELDGVEATSTPAAGKSKTMKVINTSR